MKFLALLLLGMGLILQFVGLVMTWRESSKHLDSVLDHSWGVALDAYNAVMGDREIDPAPRAKAPLRGLILGLLGVILATTGSIVALFPW